MNQERTRAKAAAKAISLREKLRSWSEQYYNSSFSEVSDQVYDAHYRELADLEAKYPDLVSINSETQKIGSSPNSPNRQKKAHSIPMLSLENIFNKEELEHWLKRVEKQSSAKDFPKISCEYKIDGLSISLFYQAGELKRALTRGDGNIGEDVTENIKTISSIPKEINFLEELEIRGEVFMTFSVFRNFPQFSNPRNAASGSLKLLDAQICKERKLDFFAFEALFFEEKNGLPPKFESHSKSLQFLGSLGFPVNSQNCLASDLEQLEKHYRNFAEQRESLDYPVDGMVLKLDKLSLRKELKENKKYPRWAAAYKFDSLKSESQILKITCEVGRSGTLTPVASVLPVKLGGSTVKRASLHNFDFIKKRDIRVGDFVFLHKAGEIIPEVIAVNQSKRNPQSQVFRIPENCPSCESKLSEENKCLNLACPAQIERKFEHWCSKSALEIKGLGKNSLKLLLEKKLIKKIPDLYRLKDKKEELLLLEGFQEKSVTNLLSSLERSKQIELFRFLHGLGIKYLGISLAKLLSQKFKDLDSLKKSSLEELLLIEGIGKSLAGELIKYFQDPINLTLINELLELGFQISNSQFPEISPRFSDKKKKKTFVLTGTFNRARAEIESKIENSGHKVSKQISSKVDYLVCGENPGSKLIKAEKQELKIKILKDLEELEKILNEADQHTKQPL